MPPKKSARRKKSPLPLVTSTELAEWQDPDFDYDHHFNDGFFNTANKMIERLMNEKREFEAVKLKRYIDVIHNLSRKYIEQVSVNKALEPQIADSENRLRLALQLISSSEGIINAMKEALMLSWQEEDAILIREQAQQLELKEARKQTENFSVREVVAEEEDHDFGPLSKYKNVILRERDRLQGNNIELEKRLMQHRAYSDTLQHVLQSYEENLKKQTQHQLVLQANIETLTYQSTQSKALVDDLKEQNSALTETVDKKGEEISKLTTLYTQKCSEYDTLRNAYDRTSIENHQKKNKIKKLEDEILWWRKTLKTCRRKLYKSEQDHVMEHAKHLISQKKQKITHEENRVLGIKLHHTNKEMKLMESTIKALRNDKFGLEKELANTIYKVHEEEHAQHKLLIERQKLRTTVSRLSKEIVDLKQDIVVQNNTLYARRAEIDKLTVKLDEARTQESKLLKERIALKREIESLLGEHQNLEDQLKVSQDTNVELNERIRLKDLIIVKMKKQEEKMHSEKLIIQRNLEITVEDRNNTKNLLTKLNHQLSQLAFEIRDNGIKINNLRLLAEQLASNKRELHSLINAKDLVLANVRNELKLERTRMEQMQNLINEDDAKFIKLKVALDEVRTGRSVLGTLLMKRNDEISLLKAKAVTMQMIVDQGQTQYNERVEDIRLLKVEITNLRTERNCLLKSVETNADLKKELVRLQRMLAQERLQNRSLSDEVNSATAVHRWRILKGDDPEKFELTQKVAFLLRQNLKIEQDKLCLAHDLEEEKKCTEQLKSTIEKMPVENFKIKLCRQQRLNRTQAIKLRSLKANAAIDTIELQERECLIEHLKQKLGTAETHGDASEGCGGGDF